MDACPKCGSDAYQFTLPAMLTYVGIFGEGKGSEESEANSTKNDPATCICCGCGKRLSLDEARGEPPAIKPKKRTQKPKLSAAGSELMRTLNKLLG